MHTKSIILITLFSVMAAASSYALDVIPGLKVYGGTTRAAYGNSTNPTIYVVNTLNPTTALADSTRNGVAVKTGGLDTILETPGDNKFIIFEVSGNIDGGSVSPVYVTENYITIAGQTAPSPGITLKNYGLVFAGHDILIQHIRVRMTDSPTGTPYDDRDGIDITSYPGGPYAQNVVMDHCSISWATDENVGVGSTGAQNLTVSNCIIAEGLSNGRHSKGEHSKGLISVGGTNIEFLKNLFISNVERNPYFTSNDNVTSNILTANNYLYNIKSIGMQMAERITVDKFDFIGNVTEGGPNSGTYAAERIYSLMLDQNDSTQIYFSDNRCDSSYVQSGPSDWTRVREATGVDNETTCKSLTSTFTYPTGWTAEASSGIKAAVLQNVGARPKDRDTVDSRLISEATNGTGASIVDTVLYTNADCVASGDPLACCTGSGTGTCRQVPEGGFPSLAENTNTHTDIPSSPHADDDSDGYTNLEEWAQGYADDLEYGTTTTTPHLYISGSGHPYFYNGHPVIK